MSPDREQLRRLARTGRGLPSRPFAAIAEEAMAFRTAAVATLAAGMAASAGQATGRDALAVGLDVLRDPLTEADGAREELLEAIARAYPVGYADPAVVADRLDAMSEESLAGVMNAVKGAMFELRVGEMLDAGELPMPDDAVAWEPMDFTTPGADGRFLDAEGETVGWFQIKASGDADIISRHFDRYPEVDTVVTTREAAADAAGTHGVVDSGVGVDELVPNDSDAFVDVFTTSFLEGAGEVADDVPLLTLGLIAAELAATHARGGDMPAALEDARRRAGRALTWSALGTGTAALTGLEPARIVVSVGGRVVSGWTGRAAVDQERTVARLNLVRERLDSLRAA